jgi:hypothetical protein
VSFLFFGLCGLGAGLGAEAAGEQERALKAQRWIMPPSSPDHDALSFPGVITVFCCKSQQEEKAKAKERERERIGKENSRRRRRRRPTTAAKCTCLVDLAMFTCCEQKGLLAYIVSHAFVSKRPLPQMYGFPRSHKCSLHVRKGVSASWWFVQYGSKS